MEATNAHLATLPRGIETFELALPSTAPAGGARIFEEQLQQVEPTGCWVLRMGRADDDSDADEGGQHVVCIHTTLLALERDGLPLATTHFYDESAAYATWVKMGDSLLKPVDRNNVYVYARGGEASWGRGGVHFWHACDVCQLNRSEYYVANCLRAGGDGTHRVCPRCHNGGPCRACED